MSNFKLYSVNWQDGMLLTEQHLREQEQYLEELVRWQGLKTGDNYGLVSKSDSSESPLEISFTRSGDRARVEVLSCQAITPDGSMVEISQRRGNTLVAERVIDSDSFPVYVAVDKLRKKEVGDPDPNESVPRMPYLVHDYVLLLDTPKDRPLSTCVQIAGLDVRGGDIEYATEFFAPCVTIASEVRLQERVKEFHQRLDGLMSLVWQAYRAASPGGADDRSSDLQGKIRDVVLSMGLHLISSFDSFLVGRNTGHPLSVHIYFKRLFRTFSALLNLEPAVRDYLNERFFTKELNLSLPEFTSDVDSFLWTEYNHADIGNHMLAVDRLLSVVLKLMSHLARSESITPDVMLPETMTYKGRTFALAKSGERRVEQRGDLSYLMISLPEAIRVNDLMILVSKQLFSDNQWSSLNVRLSANDALALGQTDPAAIDITTFGNKVAISTQDMFRSQAVTRVNMVLRNVPVVSGFESLGPSDLGVYVL